MSRYTPVTTQEHDTSANAPIIPESDQGKRDKEGRLGYLLRQASAAQRLRMERAMADVGVTLPQFLVLTTLRAYPNISNADLTRLTMLTPQTTSVTVTNLERNDATTRRPHTVHGRIQHTDITPNGSALLTACRERSGGIEWNLLEDFSPEEEEVVRCWLVYVAKLGSGKPTPQPVHRFSSAAVFDVLGLWVAVTIMRCILRYI